MGHLQASTPAGHTHGRTSQKGRGTAAPDSGKAIIFFGQKPAAKNEKLYLLNEKQEAQLRRETARQLRMSPWLTNRTMHRTP